MVGPEASNDPFGAMIAAAGGLSGTRAAGSEALATVTGRPVPPVAKWQPAFCGDMDMEIRADGSWWHEGTAIRRPELVRLFASILRREADGDYYLVTPVEKVRIRVALHPLTVIDADWADNARGEPTLWLRLNTGGRVPLDGDHPLALEPRAANAAYVALDNGLTALFSRAAWYRLVEAVSSDGVICSAGSHFTLI